jgi:hypothetical protein
MAMSWIRKALLAFGAGLALTIVGGIVAFLNEVHLEVSFDKLKDFKATDLASYARLGTALKFDLETAEPEEFVGYFVDDDEGKPEIRKVSVSFKNYRLRNRLSGDLMFEDDHSDFAITGYYNNDRIVFAHHGPISGTGVFILDSRQIGLTKAIYVGYAIVEELKHTGSSETWILQCPFLMIDEASAVEKFGSIEAARTAFPILSTNCTPFAMPPNVIKSDIQK